VTEDCVFCGIIDGDIPGHIVHETEETVAFLDAEPVSEGHTLVVPRRHVETIYDSRDMDYLWTEAVRVANAIREALDPEGMNLQQNTGEAAGQEVDHLHLHLTPRYTGDEVQLDYDREELGDGERLAEKLSAHL
jgi:Diadenosine tetraphosphate (Ap4A) hydrolase and other HIT family hydrolases